MNCKGCGTDLSGKPYKMVAHWGFCLECFEGLLREKKEKPREASERKAVDRARRCELCKTEIPQGDACEMLGLVFCHACHQSLVKRPEPKARREEEEEEEGMSPVVEQVRVDVRKTVECQGCGRTIPALGAKEVDGEPCCPECYYTLKE